MKAVGFNLGGLKTKLLPLLGIIAALSAAIAVFRWAYQKNLGGIADFVQNLKAKITLAWDGLTQLFEKGGFSGAVMDELARSENKGLKAFLISTYRVVHKLKQAWLGFKEGFSSAKVVLFFTVDLPAAFNFAYDKVAGFFTGIGEFFSSIGSWFINLFASIAGGIKQFFSPVVDFFDQVRRGIQKVIDTIAGGLRWLMDKVPSFLLPESFMLPEKIVETQQTNVVKREEKSILLQEGFMKPGKLGESPQASPVRKVDTETPMRPAMAMPSVTATPSGFSQ